MMPVPGDGQTDVEGRPGRPNRAARAPAGVAGGAANGPRARPRWALAGPQGPGPMAWLPCQEYPPVDFKFRVGRVSGALAIFPGGSEGARFHPGCLGRSAGRHQQAAHTTGRRKLGTGP